METTTPQKPSSDGLRDSAKILQKVPGSIGPVWTAQAHWLRDNYNHEEMEDVLVKLYRELNPISQAADGTPDGELADAIRDVFDIFWLALPSERYAVIESRFEKT